MYNYPNNNNAIDSIRAFFLKKEALPRLILINVAIFIIVKFIGVIYWLTQSIGTNPLVKFLAVPADLSILAKKPWTIFTYMFLHEGFFHLFFNMIVLYFSGAIFLQYLSQRKLVSTYILGGIFGGLFYILTYNIFPVFSEVSQHSLALGASASVLAILVAAATYIPDYQVNMLIIRLKLKHLAIILVILDFLSIQGDNPGGHIAHLGGALWGFLYIWILQHGTDIYAFFNNFYFSNVKLRKKSSFSGRTKKNGRPLSDQEYNDQRAVDQEIIDAILDKIAKKGYSSLSSKEKDILFKSSNKS